MQVLSIGKKKRVYALAFSPGGWELAAVCGDGQLRVWDLATGQVRHALPIEKTPCGYSLAYLGESKLVLAGADLRCWDAAGWGVVRPGMVWGCQVRVSPDGRYLAEADSVENPDQPNAGLTLYEAAGWRRLPSPAEHADTTGGLAFSRDGRLLASGHMVRAGQQRRYHSFFPGGFEVPAYEYVVHLREVPSGRVVRSLDGWQQRITRLAFSPDGAFLAGTAGPRLRVWDLWRDREAALHKRGTKHFQGLSFTPDGRQLATVSNDETVRLWDTGSWQERRTFTWEIGKLLNIAFAPDGCRAAAGSDAGNIILWDVDD
jgi:WD40 repeat protein